MDKHTLRTLKLKKDDWTVGAYLVHTQKTTPLPPWSPVLHNYRTPTPVLLLYCTCTVPWALDFGSTDRYESHERLLLYCCYTWYLRKSAYTTLLQMLYICIYQVQLLIAVVDQTEHRTAPIKACERVQSTTDSSLLRTTPMPHQPIALYCDDEAGKKCR